MSARFRWPFLMLFVTAPFGCAVEEIVLASSDAVQPEADAGAGTGPGETAELGCRQSDDCEEEEFCAMSACNSAVGVCRRPSILCEPEANPVCGCDGVTYFNDCWRERNKVRASTAGECQLDAQRCGTDGDAACPAGAYCSRLLPYAVGAAIFQLGGCLPELPGRCWGLPFDCSPDPRGERWVSCTGGCVDFCTAVKSEMPHVLLDSRQLVCEP